MERNTKLERAELYGTALLQVMFVSMNVTFISRGLIAPMVITGFLISLIWTYNVKKVAFGTTWDRMAYAGGAATGTFIGYHLAHYLTTIL